MSPCWVILVIFSENKVVSKLSSFNAAVPLFSRLRFFCLQNSRKYSQDSVLSSFFLLVFVRQSSHIIQFTSLQCMIQWMLGHS